MNFFSDGSDENDVVARSELVCPFVRESSMVIGRETGRSHEVLSHLKAGVTPVILVTDSVFEWSVAHDRRGSNQFHNAASKNGRAFRNSRGG